MRRRVVIPLFAGCVALCACTEGSRAASASGSPSTAGPVTAAPVTSAPVTAVPANAAVTYVTDGDTINVRIEGRQEAVRLLGIDTPEVKDPRKPVQCYGREASDYTKHLLPKGTLVRLERDVEPRDQYGRLLAYVTRASDGLFVNLELARQGYASLLTYPPNVAHVDELRAAVDEARAAGRGLWGVCGGPGVPLSTVASSRP